MELSLDKYDFKFDIDTNSRIKLYKKLFYGILIDIAINNICGVW